MEVFSSKNVPLQSNKHNGQENIHPYLPLRDLLPDRHDHVVLPYWPKIPDWRAVWSYRSWIVLYVLRTLAARAQRLIRHHIISKPFQNGRVFCLHTFFFFLLLGEYRTARSFGGLRMTLNERMEASG